uniref:Aldedh domain-containing protein n=1 Tax=Heterorhabditis bacteriophora TaxID=37862 RepID=A0A1I7XLZ9_HETBA
MLHHISPSTLIDEPVRALNYVKNDPVGVAGLISPWNLPLYLLSFKLAPALVAGNTVVCKPSELTSVTAWVLMHAIEEAGFPTGVVNLVIGTGSSVGEHLVSHPDVPLISFTGSQISIVLYMFCEICLCSSRIFVHSSIYNTFVEKLVEEAKKLTVGNPTKDTTLGAINSETHFKKARDLNMPFGGTKESGMGREGAQDSLHFFTESKTVCIKY